jgi:TetR/AcrR family transcriptional regulator, repressor for uid operon
MALPADAVNPPPERRTASDRQSAILDAFERCIVRAGFHRTTMQDVAKEAGTSAGNLYRYFVSKDQLVSGLCERDRERFGADFEHVAAADDVMGALVALGRQHFVEQPRARCVQFMEIWAEATRNPEVARVCSTIDREVHMRLVGIIEAAKAAGQVPQHVDSDAFVTVISAIGDGLFMRRALDPTFDPEAGFRLLLAVLDGITSGAVDLSAGKPEQVHAAQPAVSHHLI